MVDLKQHKYDFLRSNPLLGDNIILLCLGGSRAYGTDNAMSDWDVRGCALNTKDQILYGDGFEVVQDRETDTVIYSFNKLSKLLAKSNPNTIELLGDRPEDYIYVSPAGRELLDNSKLFLSQEAYYSFGGYASAQLRRLSNKVARDVGQSEREQHILASINNAKHAFPEKYFNFPDDSINLYIGDSDKEEYDKEIFMDVSLQRYPLRDWKSMWAEMNNIVKDYAKFGQRNKNAIEHAKINKHMMHLVRLYLTCFDILEKGEIITYREKDLPLLNSIRSGNFTDNNNQPTKEFYEMVDKFEKRLEYAKKNTDLPVKPDYKKIREFVIDINESVVKGEVEEMRKNKKENIIDFEDEEFEY